MPFVRPFTKGVEGPQWEVMYSKHVQMHRADNLKQPGVSKKARAL